VQSVAALIAEFRDWWGKTEPSLDVILLTVGRLIYDGNTEFLLAVGDRGRPLGVCQIRFRLSVWTGEQDCWLEDVYVREEARGAGCGHALVEAAIESARLRGCRRMELDVNEDNEGAVRFYQSLGFTLEPKPPGRTLFISRAL
jgi:GNAT superfamily N-acetyltransferase